MTLPKGAMQFIKGLEYHFDNFVSHLKMLASKPSLEDDCILDHEAVAYLNRLGQLYYFIRSVGLLKICPKISGLYLFRRKNTGHRSIDSPKEDDTIGEQMWQSGCLERKSFICKFDASFTLKDFDEYRAQFLTPLRYTHPQVLVSYQILHKDDHADFTPQSDHPILMKEIERVFHNLFDCR